MGKRNWEDLVTHFPGVVQKRHEIILALCISNPRHNNPESTATWIFETANALIERIENGKSS